MKEMLRILRYVLPCIKRGIFKHVVPRYRKKSITGRDYSDLQQVVGTGIRWGMIDPRSVHYIDEHTAEVWMRPAA